MKHTKKKKLLAFVLCMVLVLSTAITAFAVDGNFYYVPKDTVELSHEIMKDGASQGTLYATVPGGTFKSSTDNAELQMDMQEETSESTVLEAVQTELENTGNTGYTVHQAVMGDVSFRVSTEDKAQIPEKAVNFRFENTSLDTAHAMGFVYDSSDETITLYELKEDTLQFEEDVKLETETVVVGCFDVLEKTAEEKVEDGTEPEDTKASTGVETITQERDQNGTVENPDEQTPQDQINLDDEDTPTGNIDAGKETQEKNKTLGVSIAIIIAAVVALIALFVAMKRRKKETK